MKGYFKRAKARFLSSVNLHYKIGLRVIKTVLCATICLLIALLTNNRSLMQLAAVTAIIALRTSRKDSLRAGGLRLIGTLMGGALGMACVLLENAIPYYNEGLFVLIIPVMMLVDFYICNVLSLQEVAAISSIVVLLVGSHISVPTEHALEYAGQRLVATLIGVTIATIVNILIPVKNPLPDEADNVPHEGAQSPDQIRRN